MGSDGHIALDDIGYRIEGIDRKIDVRNRFTALPSRLTYLDSDSS